MKEACPYFDRGQCRSCSLLMHPAGKRASSKLARFEEAARASLGHKVVVAPLWQPPNIFPSRTKAKFSVSGNMKEPVIGLTDQKLQSTELLECPLHLQAINEVLPFVKNGIVTHRIPPYHIERQQGELKGLILKSNEDGSQVLLRFVLRSRELLARVKKLAREIQKAFPYVKVSSVNIQPLPAAILEGEEEIFLTDERVIWETFNGVKVAFQPQSFSQVTHDTAEALYRYVGELLKQTSSRSMFDLFCGVGGFSLLASSKLEWGHGIEISRQAIECATMSCKANRIGNLSFEAGDVEQFLAGYSGSMPDAMLFNPPRRGLSSAMIERAVSFGPRVVVYSSCNPETLFRDLQGFSKCYSVKSLAPFEMFPLTEHLEVVALLEKR